MARSQSVGNESPASAESDVAIALERVADEILMVREVLDEIRSDFQWAVQNGRVVFAQSPDEVVSTLQDVEFARGTAKARQQNNPPAVQPEYVVQPVSNEVAAPLPDLPPPGNLF